VHLDITKVIYSPTDTQEKCLRNNIKIYSHITTELTTLASTNNALPDDGVIATKYVGVVLM